jgi:LemA protein
MINDKFPTLLKTKEEFVINQLSLIIYHFREHVITDVLLRISIAGGVREYRGQEEMMTKGSKIALGVVGGLLLLVLICGSWVANTYNKLVNLDQATQQQWAQVENVYQRRMDLIPNLVATVKGAAKFEQDTLTAVTEARAKVGQVSGAALGNIANDPAAFAKFQQAQDGLSSALSHLMVVVEKYPELKATEGFRDLQAAGRSENRISVERMRFNVAANDFNATRESFPTNIVASFFGSKFNDKAFFKATEGADRPPEVKF